MENVMKKTLLAVSIAPAILAASMANAVGFSDQLEFSGTIDSTAPKWVVKTDTSGLNTLVNMDIDVSAGKATNNNQLKFDLTGGRTFTSPVIFEEMMQTPSSLNQSGLLPVISVDTAKQKQVIIDVNGPKKNIELTASGSHNSHPVKGLFSFILDAGGAVIVSDGQTSKISTPDIKSQAQVKAHKEVKLFTSLDINFPNQSEFTQTRKDTWKNALANKGVTSVMGINHPLRIQSAVVGLIQAPTLTFGTSSIPSEWSASLPITITMQ